MINERSLMQWVAPFVIVAALFLMWSLRRFHRKNSVARRIAWLPGAMALQASNVAFSFWFDPATTTMPSGVLSRSIGGWIGIGLAMWYLGFYFAGRVNGR